MFMNCLAFSDVEVKVTYQVDYKGRIFVTANYDGKAGLPNFPEFGLEICYRFTIYKPKLLWIRCRRKLP